jgi:hypothetical protein
MAAAGRLAPGQRPAAPDALACVFCKQPVADAKVADDPAYRQHVAACAVSGLPAVPPVPASSPDERSVPSVQSRLHFGPSAASAALPAPVSQKRKPDAAKRGRPSNAKKLREVGRCTRARMRLHNVPRSPYAHRRRCFPDSVRLSSRSALSRRWWTWAASLRAHR